MTSRPKKKAIYISIYIYIDLCVFGLQSSLFVTCEFGLCLPPLTLFQSSNKQSISKADSTSSHCCWCVGVGISLSLSRLLPSLSVLFSAGLILFLSGREISHNTDFFVPCFARLCVCPLCFACSGLGTQAALVVSPSVELPHAPCCFDWTMSPPPLLCFALGQEGQAVPTPRSLEQPHPVIFTEWARLYKKQPCAGRCGTPLCLPHPLSLSLLLQRIGLSLALSLSLSLHLPLSRYSCRSSCLPGRRPVIAAGRVNGLQQE